MFPEEDINHGLMGGQGCPDLQWVITTKPNHEIHTREWCFATLKNIIISLYFITILLLLVIHWYILLGAWELFECRGKSYFTTVHDSFEFYKKYFNSNFGKAKTSQN